MKTLTDYIIQESLIFENANGEIITEGFWKKLGSILGFNQEKVSRTMKKWSDDLKRGYTTGQYLAVKHKDKNIKKAAQEQAKAAEKGSKELLQQTKLNVQRLLKTMDNAKHMDIYWAQYVQLFQLSEQENDNEGKELAEKFKGAIDKKWPDAESNYDKITKKEDKAGVTEGPKSDEQSNKDKPEEQKSAEGNSNLGLTKDDEPASVTPKQEVNAIKDEIKENTDFFKPLAKDAGLDGEELTKAIKTFINKSWKTVEQDEDGNAILKWKIPSAQMSSATQGEDFEERIVKGLSAILCGIMIIKHKPLMEGIYKVIDPEGKSSEEIKKILKF